MGTELRARRQHGAQDCDRGETTTRRSRGRGRARTRFTHPRIVGAGSPRDGNRDRPEAGRGTAGDVCGARGRRGCAHGPSGRCARRHRAARHAGRECCCWADDCIRGADRDCRQPAVQRVGPRPDSPARDVPHHPPRTRHGAGRGRAPHRGRPRVKGLRRPERQGRLVGRLERRGHRLPPRVLARAQRRLRVGRDDRPRHPGRRGTPAPDLRPRRRRLWTAPQNPPAGALRDRRVNDRCGRPVRGRRH